MTLTNQFARMEKSFIDPPMNPYNVYSVNLSQLSAEDQAYFKSEEYRSLSPSARIQVAKARLATKPTAEEIEFKKAREDEGLRRVYEDRAKAEEARIQAAQLRREERKRRYLD